MSLGLLVLLAAALFSIGVYGLVTRKQVIAVLLSVELMANAANVLLVAFSRFRPATTAHASLGGGTLAQSFALFALALTVAEVAVGLALVILLYRGYADTRVALASEMKE